MRIVTDTNSLPWTTGSRSYSPGSLKTFSAVAAKVGLDDWTPNELRHSAASLMSNAGMPIEQVADQLGHKDLRMLQKHYRHRIRSTIGGGTVLELSLNTVTQR